MLDQLEREACSRNLLLRLQVGRPLGLWSLRLVVARSSGERLQLLGEMKAWAYGRAGGLQLDTLLFMGWFGPRGLASIVFAVIVVNANVPHSDTIAATVTCTIILSILAHGITANPWAKGFGERFRKAQGGSNA